MLQWVGIIFILKISDRPSSSCYVHWNSWSGCRFAPGFRSVYPQLLSKLYAMASAIVTAGDCQLSAISIFKLGSYA
jgi:hypothetical protein